jgi:hypothetical protein
MTFTHGKLDVSFTHVIFPHEAVDVDGDYVEK